MSLDFATKVAKILLETSAVKLSLEKPFTWSSGWRSPIYCDNRVVLSFPKHRTLIKNELSNLIKNFYPEATTIIGVATAGIAMGALVADELGLDYAYCRPQPKEHGLQKQLEGNVHPGSKIVVFEDLISTGGSSLKVVSYLRSHGYEVIGMAAVFSYNFDVAKKAFEAQNCSLHTLSDYNKLITYAVDSGDFPQESYTSLLKWRQNPEEWGR